MNDFGPSWRDGIAFNAMVHNIDSRLVRMEDVKQRSHRENLEYAFTQAETHLGIPRLLDPEGELELFSRLTIRNIVIVDVPGFCQFAFFGIIGGTEIVPLIRQSTREIFPLI